MLYSNNKMPPYLAEIPYGFKNLWRITVSAFSLDPPTVNAANITAINLNGGEVTFPQLLQLYDYNRDISSISQADGAGILATLASFDEDTQIISYQPLVQQDISITGITSVTGDMVDNSSPQNPVVGHDAQKLDVTDYEADKAITDGAISALQLAQGADASAIAALQNNMVQGATVNGGEIIRPVAGILPITVEQLLPEDVRDAIAAKVDKTIGDASGNITQDATLSASNGILTFTEKRVNTSNSQVSTQTNSINLRDQLGIPALEAIDTRLFYFMDDANVTAYDEEITVTRTSLYRRNANGTTYTPTTTDRISVIYSVAPEFSAVGVEASRNIAAVGIVVSSTATELTVAFRRLRQYEIYNKFNGYRAGTLVYDSVAHGVFAVTQDVPRPTTALNIIPLTNEQYYDPIVDKSLMPAMTVFGNLTDSDDAGEAYTLDETRLALMRGDLSQYCGYDNYVEFLGDDVPESILTNNDWSANISLWVTDGIRFTSFSALLEYLSNFSSTSRFKISNRGIISTSYEDGGINIETIFGIEEIAAQLDAVYMPPVEDAVEGNIPIFTEGGLVEDSGSSLDDFATAAQGEKADSAVQAVTIAQGTANGTIKVSITAGGVTTTTDNVPVKGLNTAAYAALTSLATAAQGAKADSAVQAVSIGTGTANGKIKLTVDGTAAEASVYGLGTAAYTASTAYATSAQGAKADSALQSSNVVDGLTSSETDAPLSANQGRILSQRIAAISSAGRPIGGFATFADAYANTDDFAGDLQPVEVGNVIYIAADENHTNQPTEYTVSSIGVDGAIVYAFSRIVPASNRDFTLNPITSTEISAGAVTGNALATNAVNASKIADGSIGLAKLDPALQSAIGNDTDAVKTPLISTGSGNVVAGVFLDSNNRLNVSKTSTITGVIVNGSGFVTSASVDGLGNLVLTANGTAAGNVTVEGAGNVITNIEANGSDIVATKGYAVTQSVNSGSGNVLSGASINNGVITFTKANVSALVPNATTATAGKVQLNNTLTSASTTQALTAAQGKVLADTISAGNATIVHLAGSETITGTKTFSTHPAVPIKTVVPSNPSATQYATEAQVGTRYGKVNGATQGNLTAFGDGTLIDSGIPYSSVISHINNNSIHVSAAEKARWDANSGTSDHSQLINRDAPAQHPMSAITNLPEALASKANTADLATVATSGSYNDLTDLPTIGNAPRFYTSLKNAVDDANAGFVADNATADTASVTTAIGLDGSITIDILADITIQEVLKPSVTMRINTNGYDITVTSTGGQIISSTGIDKTYNVVFDATGSTITINANGNNQVQVFGWIFNTGLMSNMLLSGGSPAYYDSVSDLPAAASNSGKYAIVKKRDTSGLAELTDVYNSDGTGWTLYDTKSNYGTLSLIGGTYNLTCNGKTNNFMYGLFGYIKVKDVTVTINASRSSGDSGTNRFAYLVCTDFNLSCSSIRLYYNGSVDMTTAGILALLNSTLMLDNVTGLCDAPYNDNGFCYDTYFLKTDEGVNAYIHNCHLNSMHSPLSNNGNMFVDGGTYESISHGGLYVSGAGVLMVKNAHIGAGNYTGLGSLTAGMTAMTIGYEQIDRPTCYLHNCTLQSPSVKGFVAFRTATNAKLYMSMTNIDADKMMRLDYIKSNGAGGFADMTDAEKPIVYVGYGSNMDIDHVAARTVAGENNNGVTVFTVSDDNTLFVDSATEISVKNSAAIQNSVVKTSAMYAFDFIPREWQKMIGSLKEHIAYVTDISDITDELAGINALVGGGL